MLYQLSYVRKAHKHSVDQQPRHRVAQRLCWSRRYLDPLLDDLLIGVVSPGRAVPMVERIVGVVAIVVVVPLVAVR